MSLRSTAVLLVSARRVLLGAGVALTLAGSSHAQVVGFGGASQTGWTGNQVGAAGLPSVSGSGTAGDILTLTTANNGQTSTYWFNTPQSITNFTESFTYQQSGSGNPADGFAAVWQNQGTGAIGGGGGQIGLTGISSSASLVGNIYNGNVIGAAYNNTVSAGNPLTIPSLNGVNIASGNPINVSISYKESDGTLTESMTDTVTAATYTRAWRGISIQGQVGSSAAIVGFSGATGGLNANQTITNFQFTPGNAVSTPAAITPIAATGWNQNMIISAANGSANITATMDGGTAKSGDTFYETGVNTGSPAAGTPHAGVFGSANDVNHAFQLQANGAGQNDAVMLDSFNTNGTLLVTTPKAYQTLSFLVASGNGASSINATIHFVGGGSQLASILAPDWFNNGSISLYAAGRVDTNLDDFNQTLGVFPRMFQSDVTLTDTTDAVTSIDFSWGGTSGGVGGNREVIYGLSGTAAVPEPSTLALVGLGALGLYARRRRARK
jgi:hypothetical protein